MILVKKAQDAFLDGFRIFWIKKKSALKIQAFSPDTEVIEQEQVIEMLDKLIMLNRSQIILSKSKNLITLFKRLLSVLSCSSVSCSSEFSNCMFSLIILAISWIVT